MSWRPRNLGCLVFGIFWCALFAITFFIGVVGDCFEPNCQAERETVMHRWMLGELTLLVGAGLLFYRRQMKDGEF